MPLLSLTRVRLRSWRFVPLFVPHSLRSVRQLRLAPGFLGGKMLAERNLAFWTVTAWTDEAAMRAYMLGGDHRAAMPKLFDWANEASVARWETPDPVLPDWPEADRRMREIGRPSKLRRPGPDHAGLSYRPPSGRGSGLIAPRG
jgi:hypothetical protein